MLSAPRAHPHTHTFTQTPSTQINKRAAHDKPLKGKTESIFSKIKNMTDMPILTAATQ